MSSSSSSSSHNSTVTSVVCDVCDDVDNHHAVFYCGECEKYMCADAEKFHAKFNANHKAISADVMKKYSKANAKVICRTHNQPFAFFDTKCECLVCPHCLHLDHFGHSCQSLSDAGVGCQQRIEELLVRVHEMRKSVQTAEVKVSHVSAELRTRQQQISMKIKETFDRLHDALDARENALQVELSQHHEKKAFVLDSQHEQLHTFTTCLTSLSSRAQDAINEGSDVTLMLSLRSELSTILASLEEHPPPVTPKETAILNFSVNANCLCEGISRWGVFRDNAVCVAITTAEGPGLSAVQEGGTGKFTITAWNDVGEVCCKGGDVFDVEVVRAGVRENDEEERGHVDIVDNRDGTHAVTYTVPERGRGEIRVVVRVNGENIYRSPFRVRILRTVDSLIFHRTWGENGTGDGQFYYPYGVALSLKGEVFVCDYSSHRIQVFSSAGDFLRTWGSYGKRSGQFNHPTDVAVSETGEVFVCDCENHRIEVFDVNGRFLRKWGSQGKTPGQFSCAYCIALSPNGEVFVCDSNNHRIQVFDINGRFLRTWGSQGSDIGQFRNPTGLSISCGEVYVVDYGNYRVQVFTLEGTFVRSWGSQGNGNGQFQHTWGIAVSAAGNVFVCDESNHRVQVFSLEGQFLHTWGSQGNGNGQFNSPMGVAVSSSGELFICDQGNNRIQVFG